MTEPLLMGFILSVNDTKKMNLIKLALSQLIGKEIDRDDRAYLFVKGNVEIPKRAAGFFHTMPGVTGRVNLPEAIEKTTYILGKENLDDYRKLIFVITDKITDHDIEMFRRVSNMNDNSFFEITYIFCDFGDKDWSILNDLGVTYWKVNDPSEFRDEIIGFLKELEERVNGRNVQRNEE